MDLCSHGAVRLFVATALRCELHPGGSRVRGALNRVSGRARRFTLKKLECSKQACYRLDIRAWNNGIGRRFYFRWFSELDVMINRDSRGYSYSGDRGEILGPSEDAPRRKHLPSMFSLIKNESQRFEGDQIPP